MDRKWSQFLGVLGFIISVLLGLIWGLGPREKTPSLKYVQSLEGRIGSVRSLVYDLRDSTIMNDTTLMASINRNSFLITERKVVDGIIARYLADEMGISYDSLSQHVDNRLREEYEKLGERMKKAREENKK